MGKIGSQQIVGENSLPQSRRELCDACSRVSTNTLQDIDEIVVGIDLMQATGREQTLSANLPTSFIDRCEDAQHGGLDRQHIVGVERRGHFYIFEYPV